MRNIFACVNNLISVITFLAIICAANVPQTFAQTQCENLPGEASLVYNLNTIESASLRNSSIIVSDALMPLIISTSVGLYAYGALPITLVENDADNFRYASESGLQLAVTEVVTYGIAYILKEAVGRQRPYQAYPECITAYETVASGSWPSGHASGSAALATTLSLRYPKWYVIGPSVLYALYTGFARMNLGVHYLSDVLSGYAIGIGTALLVNIFNDELFNIAGPILPEGMNSNQRVIFGTQVFSFSYNF